MPTADTNRFNTIVVIDSIPTGESQTARRLLDDLYTYSQACPPSPKIEYHRAGNRDDFLRTLSSLRDRARNDDLLPLLHIECHGDEDGLQLADLSLLDWADLKQPLIDLNAATQLNLMLIVAACTGAAMVKAASTCERAPFWGLIGPTIPLSASLLEAAFGNFYRTLLQTKSPGEAIRRLDECAGTGTFWRITAQGLFLKAWNLYRESQCTEDALIHRLRRMEARYRAIHGKAPPNKPSLAECLRDQEQLSYEKFAATFFMHDLFPQHIARFDVPYEPAMPPAGAGSTI